MANDVRYRLGIGISSEEDNMVLTKKFFVSIDLSAASLVHNSISFALCVLPWVSYSVPKPAGYKFASLVSFNLFKCGCII